MIYQYKCQQCEEMHDIAIQTTDIMDKVGRIEQDELAKRMYQPRFCDCGGELKKQIVSVGDALFFEAGIGKGKISQRFK